LFLLRLSLLLPAQLFLFPGGLLLPLLLSPLAISALLALALLLFLAFSIFATPPVAQLLLDLRVGVAGSVTVVEAVFGEVPP